MCDVIRGHPCTPKYYTNHHVQWVLFPFFRFIESVSSSNCIEHRRRIVNDDSALRSPKTFSLHREAEEWTTSTTTTTTCAIIIKWHWIIFIFEKVLNKIIMGKNLISVFLIGIVSLAAAVEYVPHNNHNQGCKLVFVSFYLQYWTQSSKTKKLKIKAKMSCQNFKDYFDIIQSLTFWKYRKI